MDSHLRRLAARQQDVVAAWQLLDEGWSPKKSPPAHAQAEGRMRDLLRDNGLPEPDAVEYDLGRSPSSGTNPRPS